MNVPANPTQALPAAAPAPVAPVLSYAQQEQRWQKGVLWLVWMVCIATVLRIPSQAALDCRYVYLITKFGAGHWWEYAATVVWGCTRGITSLGVFFLPISGLVVLTGGQGARNVMRWIIRVVIASEVIEVINVHIFPLGTGFEPFTGPLERVLSAASASAVAIFPLLLLAVVLRRPSKAKRWAAAGIWWTTAVACLLASLSILWQWYADFHFQWLRVLNDIFVLQPEGSYPPAPLFSNQLHGIGTLGGTFAAIAVYFVILWTALRGAKGRFALMICAALWAVYALGSSGSELWIHINSLRENWVFYTPGNVWFFRLAPYFDVADALGNLALWLAFALSIRVALQLTRVREFLDTRKD